jgi:hypothetical protein
MNDFRGEYFRTTGLENMNEELLEDFLKSKRPDELSKILQALEKLRHPATTASLLNKLPQQHH